jgi:hypothetical protein
VLIERRLAHLHQALVAAVPIQGLAFLNAAATPPTVRIEWATAPTAPQIATANSIIAAWDWSAAADQAARDADEPDLAALRDQATQAVADINAYLAIGSPTQAQAIAEVRAIDLRQRAIIKALGRIVERLLA